MSIKIGGSLSITQNGNTMKITKDMNAAEVLTELNKFPDCIQGNGSITLCTEDGDLQIKKEVNND